MKEIEIYKKLIVEKFNLNLELEVKGSNNAIGYFELETTQDELKQIKDSVNIKKPIFSNKDWNSIKRPLPWTVYLVKNPKNTMDILPDIPVYSFDAINRIILNKGHLVAKSFQKYLVTDTEDVKFFYKNNIRNIILQFANINSGKHGYKGQLSFEAKVRRYLKKNESIYYKIEPKFFDDTDKVPAGCELIAFGEGTKVKDFNLHDEVPYHVFIPNVGEEEFWKKFKKKVGPQLTEEDIKAFYREGNF